MDISRYENIHGVSLIYFISDPLAEKSMNILFPELPPWIIRNLTRLWRCGPHLCVGGLGGRCGSPRPSNPSSSLVLNCGHDSDEGSVYSVLQSWTYIRRLAVLPAARSYSVMPAVAAAASSVTVAVLLSAKQTLLELRNAPRAARLQFLLLDEFSAAVVLNCAGGT